MTNEQKEAACPKCGITIPGAICKRIDCARLATPSPPKEAAQDKDEELAQARAEIEEMKIAARVANNILSKDNDRLRAELANMTAERDSWKQQANLRY